MKFKRTIRVLNKSVQTRAGEGGMESSFLLRKISPKLSLQVLLQKLTNMPKNFRGHM